MNLSTTREAKAAATPYGVYTVQCTEATGGANTAMHSRQAALSANYRLRQSSLSARFADLYATRRAAIVNSHGSHVDESYAVRFPARAAASVLGRAEALRACSRYFPTESASASEYMFQCVDRQYKAEKAAGGIFRPACQDGLSKGDADTARIAALGAEFRAGHLSEGAKAQMRYDVTREAMALARGCNYEEEYFYSFPKMSGAMRYSTGAYAASVTETQMITGGDDMSMTEIISGDNLDAAYPSYKIRPAVTRKTMPWTTSPIKSYAYMSEAAVKMGIEANSNPFEPSKYNGWKPGWKPVSSLSAQYSS